MSDELEKAVELANEIINSTESVGGHFLANQFIRLHNQYNALCEEMEKAKTIHLSVYTGDDEVLWAGDEHKRDFHTHKGLLIRIKKLAADEEGG
jgi:hypothetical protein